MCPGDDVIFTCTVTVSGIQSLILTWINPNNGQDRKLYLVNDVNIGNDPVVGAFTTKLVDFSNDTIISTATIGKINFVDVVPAGINCLDSIGNNKTLHVIESGTKIKY